ncbi:hypothetical protein SKAU_G00411690 [Synaphobranchus kaupii]|uniref:Uncharacterized protein n=1 Tax=Synaphobranchus kaupii TaxID=118154 RepID=A0A9Q1E7X1_SYNKA|nr:hypothetical protein SKAU_G00411690 [Synaphobranchus kaupii]
MHYLTCIGYFIEAIADCMDRTLETWGITKDKVLLIVTDNGSNIVKAVKLLRRDADPDQQQASASISYDDLADSESNSDTGGGGKLCALDMLKRLLETKLALNEVLEELQMDTLLTSNWTRLENIMKLLEPFAVHTDQLQTDSQSLSDVIHSLLNLEAHLQSTGVEKKMALLKLLIQRFASILDPASDRLDPTPAGACLMDPSVSLALQPPEMQPMKKAAESFIVKQTAKYSCRTAGQQEDDGTQAPTTAGNATSGFQK